jgi:hypothetical protein
VITQGNVSGKWYSGGKPKFEEAQKSVGKREFDRKTLFSAHDADPTKDKLPEFDDEP